MEAGLLLHTSPEFAMKRLLAAGSGPIYQLARVFRREEAGRWHNPEFTMLEWYRPGFDHHALMDEICELLECLQIVESASGVQRISYAELFESELQIDPHAAEPGALEAAALQHVDLHSNLDTRDEWLDLLMGQVLGPKLGQDAPCFVYDYPASQAALAKVRDGNPPVAERFELYWKGLELANGFHELSDAAEQRERFEAEQRMRAERRQFLPVTDEYFLAALESGLPDCAGVAVGIDRLLALMLGKPSVNDVLSFPIDRV